MSEFISYSGVFIGDELKFFMLTDKEVFSKKGREILLGCRENDVIGHEAINNFFAFGKPTYVDSCCSDFWNRNKIPKFLLQKLSNIKKFDKYWGRMFNEGYFSRDNLVDIILKAPNEWKEKAWKQLQRQNPSNDNLYTIIIDACTSNEWKERAYKLLSV